MCKQGIYLYTSNMVKPNINDLKLYFSKLNQSY